MPLAVPKLDPRGFEDLLADAKRVIVKHAPEWTDRSPNDPGMALVEVFAHLTDVMLYRLNRLPVTAYVEFLRLAGVKLQPPSAALARLRFSREKANDAIEIPRGTRVTIARNAGSGATPVFSTMEVLRLERGATSGEVLAIHADFVEAEEAEAASGLPGFRIVAKRPPIIARTGDDLDLVVGVEVRDVDPDDADAAIISADGRRYRVWREVESFALARDERYVYVADRASGTIDFAPSMRGVDHEGMLEMAPSEVAAVPQAGRRIRLWYRRGGGADGNVVANSLTVLKDAMPGITVTNPEPAAGGRAAETLENAMMRAPHELYSLERAVTARDFERVAIGAGGTIERALAITGMDLWRHAEPGTVEVLLVPHVPDELRSGAVSEELVQKYETADALQRAQSALDARRPLGTKVIAEWVRYKGVRVKARVVVRRGEDPARIRQNLLARLHALITPLPSTIDPTGWEFGESLRIGQVYDLLLAEPGVRYADDVRLIVDHAPDRDVSSLATDWFQPRTFYAAAGDTLFRSFDNGDGWESIRQFPGESVTLVKAHAQVPGLLAAITSSANAEGTSSRIHISRDCGETWSVTIPIRLSIDDLEWLVRDNVPLLLLATDGGLYELSTAPGSTPILIQVEESSQKIGFFAVAATITASGAIAVAVAARGTGGVYLSAEAARPGTFRHIGLKGEDIRVLAVQQEGPNDLLFAGVGAPGEVGKGCYRWRIWDAPDAHPDWEPLSKSWDGGSCLALAFSGTRVLATSHRAGVLWLDTSRSDSEWHPSEASSGLPIQQLGRFEPLPGLAVSPSGTTILAGGPRGVFRTNEHLARYAEVSSPEFTDKVTLPETWLFTSGAHEIDVVVEGERR